MKKEKKKEKSEFSFKNLAAGKEIIYLLTPLLILMTVLSFLSIYNLELKEEIGESKKTFNKTPVFSPVSYPAINDVLSNNSGVGKKFKFANLEGNVPDITAEGAIVVDDDSKVVLFSKNENLRFSMASTTKIMTALTALDYFKQDDILTVKTEDVEGAVVGFSKGEKVYFKDMLYAMLLPSGNDAALAIAENYPAGKDEFIKKMNEKAVFLNLYNTHFSDSAGLFDDGDYTTVFDLFRLSSIALKNKVFREIVSTKEKTIYTVGGTNKYFLSNLNKLLGLYGVDGIKTGFTEEAGGILTTSKTENGHRLIIVVMKSDDRFEDTRKLLSFLNGKINYLNFNSSN